MKLMDLIEIIICDAKRYLEITSDFKGISNFIKLYMFHGGFIITINYRLCKYLEKKKYCYPLWILQRYCFRKTCIKYGCDIPSNITIGKGLKIDHPVGIVINSQAIIGDFFTIKSGSVIGKKDDKGAAVIGNNVMLGVHSLLIGHIIIGDNVDIGAGAIVTHDIPDNCVVRGIPSKITRLKTI